MTPGKAVALGDRGKLADVMVRRYEVSSHAVRSARSRRPLCEPESEL
jgi:hypothetical protein